MERRHSFGVFTTDISLGYVRFVDPSFVVTPWLMAGDEFGSEYSPVEFR